MEEKLFVILYDGEARPVYNVSGTRILKYEIAVLHKGLNETKIIRAPTEYELEIKVDKQKRKWDEKWSKAKNIENVEKKNIELSNEVNILETLLEIALSKDHTFSWDTLKLNEDFSEKATKHPKLVENEYPSKPDRSSNEYIIKYNLLDILFKSKKLNKIKKYRKRFFEAINQWEFEKKEIDKENENAHNKYKNELRKYKNDLNMFEEKKKIFYEEQYEHNENVENMKKLYEEKEKDTVIKYCEKVLSNSAYPEYFPKYFEIDYNPDTEILIVEYELPSPEIMPQIKEVKYIISRKEVTEKYFSKTGLAKIYDFTIYQITLRTLYELFNSDKVDAITSTIFNGWVNYTNKATGKSESSCILSIHVEKSAFNDIDLLNVEPKICFKSLKGISASKLIGLAAIAPILQITKADSRFIEGREIADTIEEYSNIAIMDWQDFEHLIRELFEKEFSTYGGEVKVTQSSRDKGVDAIIFDPDPLRGGKIVVQAKRYTNVVGVDAVRDLYGTVINEGATKGILVTTSDYGPDSYDFAKDKPLTLINGNNLLYLLELHGHKCKIDLKEAKRILKEDK